MFRCLHFYIFTGFFFAFPRVFAFLGRAVCCRLGARTLRLLDDDLRDDDIRAGAASRSLALALSLHLCVCYSAYVYFVGCSGSEKFQGMEIGRMGSDRE